MQRNPTSGYEPPYRGDELNGNEPIRAGNNCYAYSLNDLFSNRDDFPQPGMYADVGRPKPRFAMKEPYTCPAFRRAVFADNPLVRPAWPNVACPPHYYKVFMAVDDNANDSDFHLMRQDADGKWSHKPGGLAVTRLDASGHEIEDPMTADRGRYRVPCGYVCVPTNEYADTHSASRAHVVDNNKAPGG